MPPRRRTHAVPAAAEPSRGSRWGEFNTRLHLCLYGRAEQPRTMAIVQSLLSQTDRFTRIQVSAAAGQTRAQEDHFGLVVRCRRGLFDEAVKMVQRHNENAGE